MARGTAVQSEQSTQLHRSCVGECFSVTLLIHAPSGDFFHTVRHHLLDTFPVQHLKINQWGWPLYHKLQFTPALLDSNFKLTGPIPDGNTLDNVNILVVVPGSTHYDWIDKGANSGPGAENIRR